MIITEKDINSLLGAAVEASGAIMDIYDSQTGKVYLKDDNSCVTDADRASHDILKKSINKLYPSVPVISEEGEDVAHEERNKWESFWLIDPLDGTKEFISKNGEFTVNIALIKKNVPVFGLVSIPAKGLHYYAVKGKGVYKKEKNKSFSAIKTGKSAGGLTVVARSRSHGSESEDEIISNLGPVKTVYAGSALKFCLIAEGRADIYIRTGPTMEWDTAAGQCVAEEAGARVCDMEGSMLLYNKQSLLNPGFICAGDKTLINNIIRQGGKRDVS